MVADFEPVVQLPAYPFMIVSTNAVPATTLPELIAWIKANPAKVTQGTVGYGTIQHMCGLLMQKAIGATWQLVPYRGGAPAMQDLLSGQFNLMCTASGSFLPLVRARQIRAYAITMGSRAECASSGGRRGGYLRACICSPERAVCAKGTPRTIIDKLTRGRQAMADPAFKKRMVELARDAAARSVDAGGARCAAKVHIARWWPVMQASGIKRRWGGRCITIPFRGRGAGRSDGRTAGASR